MFTPNPRPLNPESRILQAVKARTATSLRTYEYLIPMHALKGKPPRELERVMGRFVGNHRFGNFASKISQFDQWKDPSERRAGEGSGEMGWPLLPLSCRNGQQVMRRVYSINVTVESVPERGDFAVVRMTGASFVYHQVIIMLSPQIASLGFRVWRGG
jgi:tRNA U38,U39,U40 pseudouridine synthase TruA